MGTYNPTTQQERNDIIVLYRDSKLTQREVANRFKRSTRTIRKVLSASDVAISKNPKARWFTEEEKNDIATRFKAGESRKSISRSYKISANQLRKLLARLSLADVRIRRVGHLHQSWRGGTISVQGYVQKRIPYDHWLRPFSYGGYMPEHRFVMAEHLRRPLLTSETVHHINGDKKDNRLENLQLRAGHHAPGVALKCRCCGSQDIETIKISETN